MVEFDVESAVPNMY